MDKDQKNFLFAESVKAEQMGSDAVFEQKIPELRLHL